MPPLFEDRTRESQIVLAVVVPLLFGAVAGVFLGISAAVYSVLAVLAAIGGILAGPSTPIPPAAPAASSSAAPCSASGS